MPSKYVKVGRHPRLIYENNLDTVMKKHLIVGRVLAEDSGVAEHTIRCIRLQHQEPHPITKKLLCDVLKEKVEDVFPMKEVYSPAKKRSGNKYVRKTASVKT